MDDLCAAIYPVLQNRSNSKRGKLIGRIYFILLKILHLVFDIIQNCWVLNIFFIKNYSIPIEGQSEHLALALIY